MGILNKYITQEIVKYLFIVMVLVVGLYVTVDFFEKIDNFMEQNLPITLMISFLALKTPLIIAQMFPISLFLSVIMVFALMSKHNEVLALKSSGISVYTLLKPVLGIGVVFSVFLFFFSEIMVPLTITHANRIWQEDVRKKPATVSREKNIWIQADRSIYHIKYYNPASMSIHGVTLYFFDKNFSLTRRVDAEKGDFVNEKWVLENVMEQVLDTDTGKYAANFYEKMETVFDLVPDDLGIVVKKSEEMNFSELHGYIQKIESDGYDASGYKVDLYAKLAFPFVCIILCLTGVGIALRVTRREGTGIGIAIGIVTAFLYWIFYSFCLSLGYGEVLPPLIAAWMANLVFLCFAAVMLLHAD